jgi:NAD(P)-dependent dehydrogenase (short-subunit alcohol dehydrogenase family)
MTLAEPPVAVVTGASAGIGKATARMLAARGWRVIGVGRDPARCAAAEQEIAAAAAPGGRVEMLRADFTSMREVAATAAAIRALTPRIDVLINNAGGVRDRLILTDEGNEATFAANQLAPFLLTRELMSLLTATAAALPPGSVRVIAVASSAHRVSQGLEWDDLQSLRNFKATPAYCQAKLANILFTRELARRCAGSGIVAHAIHPGIVASNFAVHGDQAMQSYMANADRVEPDEPAKTLLWLATAAEAGRNSGRYFHAMAEESPSAEAQDDEDAIRLWSACERLVTAASRSRFN